MSGVDLAKDAKAAMAKINNQIKATPDQATENLETLNEVTKEKTVEKAQQAVDVTKKAMDDASKAAKEAADAVK
jgi:hypothetical protein